MSYSLLFGVIINISDSGYNVGVAELSRLDLSIDSG